MSALPPEPLFLRPPSSLFTLAQARRVASSSEPPRLSLLLAISALRSSLSVYFDLSPCGIPSLLEWLRDRRPFVRRRAKLRLRPTPSAGRACVEARAKITEELIRIDLFNLC